MDNNNFILIIAVLTPLVVIFSLVARKARGGSGGSWRGSDGDTDASVHNYSRSEHVHHSSHHGGDFGGGHHGGGFSGGHH